MSTVDAPDLLQGLNEAQRRAVEAGDGPLLIFAGAGSGKTRVLTHRIAHVIATGRARPPEILAVTFTNKAAREMRSRIEALLGESATGMWLGTFHSIGVRLLRRDGEAIGIPRDFTIYDEADRLSALRRAMSAAGIDEKRYPPSTVGHAISQAKNELIEAAQYAETAAGGYFTAQVARAFGAYEREMRTAGAVDFDDLLLLSVRLLREHQDARARYQERFRHIFVDEYQDTNHAQYVMVRLLAERHGNITVVGDDDQCLIESTPIRMADGSTRPIEDVRPGDMVLSSFGSGDLRPARVRAVSSRPAGREGVVITTRAGRRLVSTPEHTHFAGYVPGAEPDRPRSHNGSRTNVVVTLCGDHRGATPMHRISVVGNDVSTADRIRALGLSVRPTRADSSSWRYEMSGRDMGAVLATAARLTAALQGTLVLQARLGTTADGARMADSLPFVPAGSVHAGMSMFSEDGGYDLVESTERVLLHARVHDLDVEHTHNFIAGGIVTHNSIYGWRGADVRNILDFERDYPDATVVTLEQNYRSTQPILDAAHGVIRRNSERAAKRLWTERSGGDRVRLLSVYDEQEEAQAVAGEIEALVSREGFSYSDCAVLYRTNAQSRAFEDVMLRRGMPYRLVGGVRFYERREVKDVLAYLRLIANPRDAVSFARIVNVPRRKIGDRTVAELERLARRLSLPPMEAVQHLRDTGTLGAAAVTALESFHHMMEGLRTDATTLPLPQLIDRLMEVTGYRMHLIDGTPEGEERWQNVTELHGLAAEYAEVPAPDGLRQFLENVALVSDVDTMDDSRTGVTLITLHAVKGLEFPVVFIGGMEEGLLPHMRALEEGDAGISEERRLAYVGITRAQQRLYLLHAFRRHLYGSAQLAQASRFLEDLPSDAVEMPRRPGAPPVANPRQPGAARAALHAHAVRANPVEPAPQRYQQGMRARHPKFGDGTILKSTMTRSGEEVVIRFDSAGVRIFAVQDSALTPLPS